MVRFVLLRHELPSSQPRASHWDFLLEVGEHLATWTLDGLPAAWASCLETTNTATADVAVPAIRIADHRPAYLDYEGPVSNDRGVVTRCDRGEYECDVWTDNWCRVRLHGALVRGVVELRRLKGDAWELTLS